MRQYTNTLSAPVYIAATQIRKVDCETEKVAPIHADMVSKILNDLFESDKASAGSWVAVAGSTPQTRSAPPQSGQTASLYFMGLSEVSRPEQSAYC